MLLLRKLFVVFVTLLAGSVCSYVASDSLPEDVGLMIGALIFGGTLLLLGIYVVQDDPKRRQLDGDRIRFGAGDVRMISVPRATSQERGLRTSTSRVASSPR